MVVFIPKNISCSLVYRLFGSSKCSVWTVKINSPYQIKPIISEHIVLFTFKIPKHLYNAFHINIIMIQGGQ